MLTTRLRSPLSMGLCLSVLAVCRLDNLLYGEMRRLEVHPSSGVATAVVVDDLALAHTTQLLPVDQEGRIARDLEGQVAQLLANLSEALAAVGSDATQIARLNVYLSPRAEARHAQQLLAQRLLRNVHPAVAYVVTPLANEQALLAVDAIAGVAQSDAKQVFRAADSKLATWHGTPVASVLPRGRAIYISGMAAKSSDLASATTATMEQLHGVLKILGLQPEHVVHVKSFLKPMREVAVAREAIRQSCPAGWMPPLSFVEWTNGLPIEIEMIAFLPGDAEPNATVQLLWQPGEQRSPVYCRYAVVDSPTRIYVSGLLSRGQRSSVDQVRDIFNQLEGVLQAAGSDRRHLVKATYYVADEDVSKALNDVRSEIYDPERPPAASKASIAGTGEAGRTITIDMLAVPAESLVD